VGNLPEGAVNDQMSLTGRVVVSFLLLQVLAISYLWTINGLSASGERGFALFLAVDLVSFAIVSHIYLTQRGGEEISRAWVFLGASLVLILLFASIA
jgi:hypothetical protein